MTRTSADKAQRYRQAYAVLLAQIKHLVALAQQDPNIGALILYGSLARLKPHLSSDVDLLVLCQNPQAFIHAEEASLRGMYLIVEVTSPAEEWPLSPMVTDLAASDLPPALLANITEDGVLLYHREGSVLPTAFTKLLPYERWAERLDGKLKAAQVA